MGQYSQLFSQSARDNYICKSFSVLVSHWTVESVTYSQTCIKRSPVKVPEMASIKWSPLLSGRGHP